VPFPIIIIIIIGWTIIQANRVTDETECPTR